MFRSLLKAPVAVLFVLFFLYACNSSSNSNPSDEKNPDPNVTDNPPSSQPPPPAAAQLPVDEVNGQMSVMVLGSGGPIATPRGRASAGYLIFKDGAPFILMDAGGGTYQRLAASGTNVKDLGIVLLSHLHVDHTGDLSSIIKTVYFHNRGAQTFRESPINIYGPDANGFTFNDSRLANLIAALNINLPAAVDNISQFPSTSGYINGHYRIETGLERYLHFFTQAINGGVFDFTATNVSPAFQPTASTGDEGPSVIRVRTILETNDGLTIKAIGVNHGFVPSLAFRIEYAGLSVAYSGDTSSLTDNMVNISMGADILIYDTAINADTPPPFSNLHTIPARIGEVATQAGVAKLLLSHITPQTEPRLPEVIQIIRDAGFTGVIQVAKDLDVYNLGTMMP